MRLKHENYEQATVLAIHGELVAEETDRLRKYVLEQMEASARDFVLDLTEMDFIDSRGLETLIWLQDQCAERLGQVRLAGCRENVQTILDITHLAARFDCHDEIEPAIKSLG